MRIAVDVSLTEVPRSFEQLGGAGPVFVQPQGAALDSAQSEPGGGGMSYLASA